MAEAVLFNVAQDFLENLGSKALEEIAAAWGFKDQLEKLKETATMINAKLADAEQRQVQDKAVQLWLERLRSVVYDADDLFDEFSTIVKRKELMTGCTLSKEVRLFFSYSNQAAIACKMARQVKKIRGRLDDIKKDGDEYAFRQIHGNDIGQALLSLGSRETYSKVDAEVIGREEDGEAIVKMLMLDPNDGENVSVVSIVGIGGLGKTSLAKLVYNDEKIEKHFELRLWVCVGDDVFDIKVIIEKILMSATDEKPKDVGIEQLQRKLCGVIDGKKYLMVLDDMWIEDREKWLELKNLLKGGNMGSKILVTTRSWEVAKVAGTTTPYELKGLSEEKSWLLFERMAFGSGQQQLPPNLVEIGKEIVKKCANVPLAIKTLGCHLYGKEERVWLLLKENELPKIPEGGDKIMAILKISYHHLPSPLKNCFAYCSLYPKDYVIEKKTLISLWMAQGFIIPSSESQSLEDAGEMYFQNLLQRCFFQDIERDKWGDIKRCKMHDLMHDLARDVAGSETIVAKSGMGTFDDKSKRAHHLSFDNSWSESEVLPTSLFELKSLRTFLFPKFQKFSQSTCHQTFSSFSCLRVLDLNYLKIESLPNSIGDLLHLRYLDLSWNDNIKQLPASITKLQNLQTLKLNDCNELKILPMDIRKLINLRHLDVSGCDSLTCMPAGIGTLTNLHKLKLDYFIVGSKGSAAKSSTIAAQLGDLNALDKLRGTLRIKINGELRDPANEAKDANLGSKSGLTKLAIEWNKEEDYDEDDAKKHDHEVVLDGLQPHANLRKLKIISYGGQRPPNWASMDNLNLVKVSLDSWKWCQNVPGFHRLPSLKRLHLSQLESVEYMESSNYKPASSTLFFPSLEVLTLDEMPKLKGWWNMEVEAAESSSAGEETTAVLSSTTSIEWCQQHYKQLPSFPTLRRLVIEYCPNLKSMPLCPNLEELVLVHVNKELVVLMWMASPIEYSTTTSSSLSFQSPRFHGLRLLKRLHLAFLESVYMESSNYKPASSTLFFPSLEKLTLKEMDKLKGWWNMEVEAAESSSAGEETTAVLSSTTSIEWWQQHYKQLPSFPTLRRLEIIYCPNLKYMPLCPNLEELVLVHVNKELVVRMMSTPTLKGLRSLKLKYIPEMVVLPDGLQHLTTLHSLDISRNIELTALPEWISCLTSLKHLHISGCSEVLRERCKGPNGDDWPKIQHIPSVKLFEI